MQSSTLPNRKGEKRSVKACMVCCYSARVSVMDGVVAQHQAECKRASVTSIKAIHFPRLIWHSLFVTTLVTFS